MPDTPIRLDYHPQPPPRRDLGIGIIGTGSIVNFAHLPAYQKAGYRVVGLCDVRPEAVEQTRARWGIDFATTDYRALSAHPEVQIVDVATGNEGRVEIVQEAAAAGKHVLIQKPFAWRFEEARAMVEAAERGGIKLAVNQNARWAPAYRAAREALRQGLLGEPYLFSLEMRINQDETHHHRWFARMPDFLLMDYGAHYFDLMHWWAGKPPQRVYAATTRPPDQRFAADMVATVSLEWAGRLRATLLLVDVCRSDDHFTRFRLEGTQGSLLASAAPLEEHTLDLYSRELGGWWLRQRLEGRWFPEGFIGTMGELLRAVAEDDEPDHSGRRNLATVASYLAAARSAALGRPVELREVGLASTDG